MDNGMFYILKEFDNENWESLFKKFYSKDNNFLRGRVEQGKNLRYSIYKRTKDTCHCIELKNDKIIVFYPYYSKFGFCGEDKPKKYKEYKYNDYEKAYGDLKKLVKNEQNYLYMNEIDSSEEEEKYEKEHKKLIKAVKKELTDNNIKFKEEEGTCFDIIFKLGNEKMITISYIGGIILKRGEKIDIVNPNHLYTLIDKIHKL